MKCFVSAMKEHCYHCDDGGVVLCWPGYFSAGCVSLLSRPPSFGQNVAEFSRKIKHLSLKTITRRKVIILLYFVKEFCLLQMPGAAIGFQVWHLRLRDNRPKVWMAYHATPS